VRLAIMQPYFFPYLGYYQLIGAVDKFVVFDDVNFINRGWINRNNILVNGEKFLFSIPLCDASQNKLIKDIEIHPGEIWKRKALRTIEQSYGKAKYFKEGYPIVSNVINSGVNGISELAQLSLFAVAKYVGLNTEFVDSSVQYNNSKLTGQSRIIDVCKREVTKKYMNLIGGMEIYSKDLFDAEGIELRFIKTKPYFYRQFDDKFVNNLSMIDILMFNSRDEIAALLQNYELV
jgi:hypothetical protein